METLGKEVKGHVVAPVVKQLSIPVAPPSAVWRNIETEKEFQALSLWSPVSHLLYL